MSKVETLDRELNRMILEGKPLEAFDRFYADDVVMIEPGAEPWRGKDANREREEQFYSSVREVNQVSLQSVAAGDEVTTSEWIYDLTFADGNRVRLEQVAVRTWDDGKIAQERFYYDRKGD